MTSSGSSCLARDGHPIRVATWPRLSTDGVDLVLVSGAVVDRLRAAPRRYPREIAFYDALERKARVLVQRRSRRAGLAGPWVRIYALPRS